jgi:UDP:flavonoid glycosyltransferase YjiC (YdhE family)
MPEGRPISNPRRTVVIFALGTQGDARPCIALGQGLARRGYAVRLVTSANFADMVKAAGLDFKPLSGDFQALLERDGQIVEQGLNPLAMARLFRRQLAIWASDWVAQGCAAILDAGLLIGVGSATLLAESLAQAYRLPFVQAQLQPLTPSRRLPPMPLASRWPRLPGALSLAAYQLLRLGMWQVMRPAIDRHVRAPLGLRPYAWRGPYFDRRDGRDRILYGFSEQLLPRPADWPSDVSVTGYWFADAPQWQPPQALQRFLETGAKPIYIGFGSMVSPAAEAFTATVLAAVRQSGRRAVLATGWGGLKTSPRHDDENICFIQQAPHDWLLPRVSAAIHHGGAGTTAAAARAGIASVVVPFYGDQPFWATCLTQRGVAPPALRRRGLDATTLAKAIEAAHAPLMQAQAAALGQRLRGEDGVATAIERLQQWGLLAPLPRTRSPIDHQDA